jgi:hypothetical protein
VLVVQRETQHEFVGPGRKSCADSTLPHVSGATSSCLVQDGAMAAATASVARFTVLGLLLTGACGGDDDGGPAGGGPDAGGAADAGEEPDASGVATRTVTGVMMRAHVAPGGVEEVPVDLTGSTIAALTPPAFDVHPGTGDALGGFTIPGVPVGTYYLQVDDRFLVTSGESVDLGYAILGRPDAVPATIPSTDLVFDVDNLSAWNPFGDELQMFSAGSGTVGFSLQNRASSGLPEEGNTALAGFTYDLAAAEDPMLIDGDAGDELYLTQLALTDDGANLYRRVTRVFIPDPFTMTDGEATSLGGSFADVAETDTFAVDWDRPAFDAALRAGAPLEEIASSPTLGLHTLPSAGERGFYYDSADIIQLSSGWTDDVSEVQASWAYGDPYPDAWTRMVSAGLVTYRYRGVDGAEPRALYSAIMVDLPSSAVSPETAIEPVVGPVRSPLVAGHDAFESIDGVGTMPVVSWDPPAVGEATSYNVWVMMLVAADGFTYAYRAAVLVTTDTQITIPPGVLVPGGTCYFLIEALHAPGVDAGVEPNRNVLPDGYAFVSTEPDTI